MQENTSSSNTFCFQWSVIGDWWKASWWEVIFLAGSSIWGIEISSQFYFRFGWSEENNHVWAHLLGPIVLGLLMLGPAKLVKVLIGANVEDVAAGLLSYWCLALVKHNYNINYNASIYLTCLQCRLELWVSFLKVCYRVCF